MRAAIYARYSTDRQRPASIEDQVRNCRTEIGRRGWQETVIYQDREAPGVMAKRRAGYQEMLAAARSHEFDVLVVDELSRLTRDSEELSRLRKLLAFLGVSLRAIGDGVDTLAAPESAGPVMLVKALVNEVEMVQVAHRTRRGLEGRVRAGMHPGGAPYGYRTRPVHADRPGDPPGTGPVIGYEPIVHEDEAGVVRRIFDLYAHDRTPRQIAAVLNEEGVLPPGARWSNRRSRVARTWSASAIAGSRKRRTGILNQERYIGWLVWNRSTWLRDPERETRARRERPETDWVTREVKALRIVPQRLWDAVKRTQERRGASISCPAAHRRERRLLSGFLYCAQCGARMVMTGANTYLCASRLNRGTAVCASRVTVNAKQAEQAMLEVLQSVIYGPEAVAEMVRRLKARVHAATLSEDRAVTLRMQLDRCDEAARRLADAIVEGTLTDALRERMRTVQARQTRLEQELRAARGPDEGCLDRLPGLVQRAMSDLRVMLDAGETPAVRRALSRLVCRVEVSRSDAGGHPETRLRLHGNIEGLLTWAAEKSIRVVAGARFWRLLNQPEPIAEIVLPRLGRRAGGT